MTNKTIKIVLPGYLPTPKARPRLGKGGRVYSPSAKKEMALAWQIKANLPGVQFAGEVEIVLRLPTPPLPHAYFPATIFIPRNYFFFLTATRIPNKLLAINNLLGD